MVADHILSLTRINNVSISSYDYSFGCDVGPPIDKSPTYDG